MDRFTVFADGGSLGNQLGQDLRQGYGSFRVYKNKTELYHSGIITFDKGDTNNVSEYKAMINALIYLRDHEDTEDSDLCLCTDSQLLEKQLIGEWRTSSPRLRLLKEQFYEVLEDIPGNKWKIIHISGEQMKKELGH